MLTHIMNAGVSRPMSDVFKWWWTLICRMWFYELDCAP